MMRRYRTLLFLPILLVLMIACSKATSAINTQTANTSPAPLASQAPQVQLTFPPTNSPVTGGQSASRGTFDNLVIGTTALRGVKISLTTTQPDGSVTSLNVEIDANGNQHVLKTYPKSNTQLFENGAPNPPTTLEMYVLNGMAYAPDKDGTFRPADTQAMTATLQNALLSPEGPAFWLKVLPSGSLTPQGSDETGGFQASKYAIQGALDGGTITGTLWVGPNQSALLMTELDIPAKLAGSQTEGTMQIRFTVEQADIAPIQPETAAALPTETSSPNQPTQAGTTGPSLADSFPLAPGTSLDRSNLSEPVAGDSHGYFSLLTSNSSVAQLANFYEKELPKLSWMLRYSDNNFQGGLTQNWKQDNLYLTLDFLYIGNQLVAKGRYERIDPTAAKNLPQEFPLPPQAELISASDTSWTYYLPQELTQVTTFLDQKFQALGWKQGTVMGGFGGDCGGDCGSPSYPAGVTPMPAPTLDPRPSQYYAYIIPNGDEINLEARPHQNATILVIDLTVKQLTAAGFPPDVTVYPDAQIQVASPGTVIYMTSASVETLKQFYQDALTTSGWQLNGAPFESGGAAVYRWKKGAFSLQITLTPNGSSGSMVAIACDGCT
jgi:hypothetical protein